jgi:hypothetical protein
VKGKYVLIEIDCQLLRDSFDAEHSPSPLARQKP